MRLDYDFQIAGRTVGTYVLEDDGSEIRQLVDFEAEDGERYRNEHLVRYERGRPVAYRVGEAPWVDCSDAPADHWPTSAYPLLLRAQVTEYRAVDEETGHASFRTVEYSDGRVVEREDGRLVRAFDLQGSEVVRVDWGGAISELQAGSAG